MIGKDLKIKFEKQFCTQYECRPFSEIIKQSVKPGQHFEPVKTKVSALRNDMLAVNMQYRLDGVLKMAIGYFDALGNVVHYSI